METEVEQAFCDIHRGYAGTLIFQTVEHELVFAQPVNGQFVNVFQAFLYIVCVERCQRADHLNILTAERENVSVSLYGYVEVAEECAYVNLAFAAGFYFIHIAVFYDFWFGQESFKSFPYAYRTTAWTSAAVWRRESLV